MNELSILERDFILVIQTKNRNHRHQLPESVLDENIQVISIENSEDITGEGINGKILTFIIGSDIDDPIQSAQRLHALEKNAKIILLAKSHKNAKILNESIRFSPFIGTDVLCLDESNESEVGKIESILQKSVKAEKYRAILHETNAQISSSVSTQKQIFNHHFINKLMDIAPIGIAIVSGKGKILGWNKEAVVIFNLSEANVLGTSLINLFKKPEADALKKFLETSFKTTNNKSVKALELKRISGGRASQILSFTAASFMHSGGAEKVLVLAIKDISERKAAESKLQEQNHFLKQQAKELAASNAELEQFAFVASHDLQEPLRMITGFLSRLEKKYEPILDEKGKKYIHFATDGARRMRQIILDLLEFSRVGSGDIEREEVDLNELLDSVLTLNKKMITDNKAKIKIAALPVIFAAESQMRQLFQNLIMNAVKYHKRDEKPAVNVSFRDEGKYWLFMVQDNGIGIKEEYSEKIFNIFQRLHVSVEYSGTGIGLAICKKIVEVHGGKIWVESEEGKGSTFFFSIKKGLTIVQERI